MTVWCPGCGSEYVAGTTKCADCGVALTPLDRSALGDDSTSELVEMGEWPRLSALMLRRRLERSGIAVMIEWHAGGADAPGTLIVPDDRADYAWSIINEVTPEDEMPDRSPDAYVTAIEEHLGSAAALLDELRAALDVDS